MSFKLNELLKYNNIVIQCHDNPDADALASGYALYKYFKTNGKAARFVYGGKFPLQKSNLVLMKDTLEIPAEYVTELEKPELLLNVDCQHGESNVTSFEAENYAVIDHHQVSGNLPTMAEVRSNYGSCATIVGDMLTAEGIDINSDENLATALYYGLMTDTNSFAEISHPADKDLRDSARFNKGYIVLFKNSNISRDELRIAGDALKHATYDDEDAFAIVEAEPCDPNILGIISDMLLEVDSINTCIAYSVLPFGVKTSVRSCVKEVKASELAGYISGSFGGGGGHLVKAGGFLKRDLIKKAGIEYTPVSIKELINGRMKEYFRTSEIIYAGQHVEDISAMEKYIKKDILVGFVEATRFAAPGTLITVRTLEGDVDFRIEDDIYVIIGIDGEVYPCRKNKFEVSYRVSDEEYVYPGEYLPMVVNTMTGERLELVKYAHSCVAKGGTGIYVRELDHRVKVFTAWDPEKYYLGVEGDFLAVREDDHNDIYVVARQIFSRTYSKA